MFKLKLVSAKTQLTSSEQGALSRYSLNAKLALEIGVFEAVSTSIIAKNIVEEGKIFAIDPFEEKNIFGLSYAKDISITKLKRDRVFSKIIFIQKKSYEACSDVPDNLDFIFVDGDHSFEGISSDWNLFSKKLKIGGIIALHDVFVPDFQKWKSTMDSVSYFEDVISKDIDFKILERVDSMCILKRIR